jgi:release factor glutamine methyltransferase
MIIEEALTQACRTLDRAGVESARMEARLLMRFVLNISLEALLMDGSRVLTEQDKMQFDDLVVLRAERRPMSQVLGFREFWGMNFCVTGDTLTPRPDSETLISALLQQKPQRGQALKILDLGTGTGCLLLSALSEYPQASGLGVDISDAALAIAERNAASLGLKNRALFKKSDWNSEINGVWDVILSNPPYIPTEEIPKLSPEVATYEPQAALDGGSDGLNCYLRISRFLPNILAKEGVALLEVGAGQAKDVARLVSEQGLNIADITRDLAGIERCVIIRK